MSCSGSVFSLSTLLWTGSLQLCQRRRQRHGGTAADAVHQSMSNAFTFSLHIQPLLCCRILVDCHLHGLAGSLQLYNLSSQPLFISNAAPADFQAPDVVALVGQSY
jgi:hypothetical protein